MTVHRVSERTACELLELGGPAIGMNLGPAATWNCAKSLLKLARQKPRYGYRRLHVLLERRGHEVNVKRVYRLYLIWKRV